MICKILVCVTFLDFVGGFMLSAEQASVQSPRLHPEIIAGPWESTSTSGIDGIFFNVETFSVGPSGLQQIGSQVIHIRVYHRQDGNENAGWFDPKTKATPESYTTQNSISFTVFDGERLRIHFDGRSALDPFDLDMAFLPASQIWKGKWSRSGKIVSTMLARPEPNAGSAPNAFIGDWEGEPDPQSRFNGTSGDLHIRESGDGMLSAWLDRKISGVDPNTEFIHTDQRDGELLKVSSSIDAGLILETTLPDGPIFQYRGNLSEDRQAIMGIWPGQFRLNAPDRFRRIP